MRARHYPYTCSGSRDGVALVIVLAFILLTSILIVSFIAFSQSNHSSTNSYAKAIQAQEIAQGGLQDILYDLHTEIVAGSTATTTGSTTLYLPITNWTAMPARIGYTSSSYGTDVSTTNLPPSLIRVSRASQDGTSTNLYPTLSSAYYTNGTVPSNRASPANSGTASSNGRSVPAARWNKIMMLSTNSTIPPSFATNLPDWVYVTRGGSRACTTNDLFSTTASMKPSSNLTTINSVIGRYAYVVYDEGALLDANVVSDNFFPAAIIGVTTTDKATVCAKGSEAYADLTQLPGFGFGATVAALTVADTFIKWRNASAGLTGAGATARTNYFSAIASYSTNGFLGFTSTANGTDSPLVGRQDLINYFAKIDPNFNTASPTYSAALPYLGTFSRAVTAPSWTPTTNAASGGIYNYAANAEISTGSPFSSANPNPNRDIPNVRFANAGTVTHYSDNGITSTYSVLQGDPIAQRRFSLAKLAWLTYSGPSADLATGNALYNAAGTDAAIYACFGLKWDSTNLCWDYDHTHGDPTTHTYNTILTLSEIAAGTASVDGTAIPVREPDFFELLKAGILNGSVGGQPGPVAGSSTTVSAGPGGLGFDYYSAEGDRHIRQIGANIIDQADTDNYPTAVYQNLDAPSYTSPYGEKDLYNTVFGEENLPQLQRLNLVAFQVIGLGSAVGPMDFWLEPELWNPNASGTANTSVVGTYPAYANTPTHLRLVTFGGCAITLTQGATVEGPQAINFGSNPQSPLTGGIIGFLNPQPASAVSLTSGVSFFDTPELLTGYSSATDNNYQDTSSPGTPSPGPNNYLWYPNTAKKGTAPAGSQPAFLGVWLGSLARDPITYPAFSVQAIPIQSSGEPQLTFALQYWDGSNWRYYSVMGRINEMTGFGRASNGSSSAPAPSINFASAHPDPRTDRFSVASGNYNSSGTTFNNPWATGTSIRCSNFTGNTQSGLGRGNIINLMPGTAQGFTYNDQNSSAYFLDDWLGNVAGAGSNSYQDPDGVTRPGDGRLADFQPQPTTAPSTATPYTAGGDGVMTYEKAYNSSNAVAGARARPVIMNRPFHSVGELGYVFRDQPFKTLDFWSTSSADSGLLDLFSTVDEPTVVAGEISSNAPASVLRTFYTGAVKQYTGGTISGVQNVGGFGATPKLVSGTSSDTEASLVGQAIVTEVATNGPLNNRADLVSRFSTPVYNAETTYQATISATDHPQYNKGYGETYVRALASNLSTRTWNLLIDVIAQSGHMSPVAATLNDFVVEGEKRYWLHISIDRYTGKIIDQQLEPVYE